MSKKSQFIEVSPPSHGQVEEKIVSPGHECPYCHGTGLRDVYDESRNDLKAVCAVCQGSGHLTAHIRITWEPE